MMDITRNQYFLAGLLLVLLGLQFRMIDSVDLTPELTQFLAQRTGQSVPTMSVMAQSLTPTENSGVRRNVKPPEWLGWALLSIGAVLILHSWAMKKPGT